MTEPEKPPPNPWVKIALEMGPLLLFLVVYTKWDIYVATAVFMVTSVTSLTVTYVRERKWPKMLLVSTVLVLILGGLTIWLQNDTFIKVKVTIVNALFGATLLAGMAFRRPFIKMVMGAAIRLTDDGWSKLTWCWIGYFAGVAALNELIWRNFSTDFWVKFKTIALPVLSIAFFLCLVPMISRHEIPEESEEEAAETS